MKGETQEQLETNLSLLSRALEQRPLIRDEIGDTLYLIPSEGWMNTFCSQEWAGSLTGHGEGFITVTPPQDKRGHTGNPVLVFERDRCELKL